MLIEMREEIISHGTGVGTRIWKDLQGLEPGANDYWT